MSNLLTDTIFHNQDYEKTLQDLTPVMEAIAADKAEGQSGGRNHRFDILYLEDILNDKDDPLFETFHQKVIQTLSKETACKGQPARSTYPWYVCTVFSEILKNEQNPFFKIKDRYYHLFTADVQRPSSQTNPFCQSNCVLRYSDATEQNAPALEQEKTDKLNLCRQLYESQPVKKLTFKDVEASMQIEEINVFTSRWLQQIGRAHV